MIEKGGRSVEMPGLSNWKGNMMKTKTIVWFGKVLTIFALLSSLAITSFADGGSEELSKTKGSVEIIPKSIAEGHTVIKGMEFTLYHVADASFTGDALVYSLTEEFKESGVKVDDLQQDHLPKELVSYVKSRQMAGVTKQADSNGSIRFEDLPWGLYLLVQKGTIHGFYPVSSFLVSVPMPDTKKGSWLYDVTASPKVEEKPAPGDHTPEDDSPDDPAPSKPGPGGAPYPVPVPNGPTQPGAPPTQLKEPPEKLVQTGQLNWPILVLGGLGITFMALGCLLLFRNRKVSGTDTEVSHKKHDT